MKEFVDREGGMASDERLIRIEKAIEEQGDVSAEQVTAIRQLIALCASLLDGYNNLASQLKELQEAQKQSDERLNALIDTVERVIQRGQS